jgi:cell division protein FtsI/penicillin-binding protein 2
MYAALVERVSGVVYPAGANDFALTCSALGSGTWPDRPGRENPGDSNWGDSDWYEADLGQMLWAGRGGDAVQMVMAVSAIANDGKMVVPQVVLSILDEAPVQHSTQIAGMPISKETRRP